MSRLVAAAFLAAFLVVPGMAQPAPTSAAGDRVTVKLPAAAEPGRATSLAVSLPASAAAVDGRLLFARDSLEVLGVAPIGPGHGLRPVPIDGGVAFGAYGLAATGGRTLVEVVVVPQRAGRLEVRVVVDSVAERRGSRIEGLTGLDRSTTLGVGGGTRSTIAPTPGPAPTPRATAGTVREAIVDGRIDKRDLSALRAGWQEARELGRTCAGGTSDANSDGCVDIVDVQAVSAARGETRTISRDERAVVVTPQIANNTFVVNSTGDQPDATPGNGTCATSGGLCTLRAALQEADYLAGEDAIHFGLPGTAPVTIQLNSRLPIITDPGGLTIDGYTQTGARVNTAQFGSNAIPGVIVRGNGNSAREMAFRISGPNNTIRGLIINNVWRGVFVDTPNAHHNRIVGNWIGFNANGSNAASGNFAIVLNVGAHHNAVGGPDLADRNVLGNYTHSVELYGPGVDFNTVQNNVMCIGPSGTTRATCSNGVDHNFGPKSNLIGGSGPGERNYVGPTTLQGIELSHGWDQSQPWGPNNNSLTYQINNNRVIGNWVGFRADGSYDPLFRSGLNASSADNAQGINVYDGSNDNLVEGNIVGTVYDGIQVMAPNAQRNIVRGNLIGESPLGQPAPYSGWGIKLRWGTTFDVIVANTIRNAGTGGIGLLTTSNTGAAQAAPYNIRISRNIVTDTNGKAIHLAAQQSDPTQGANTLLPAPAIASATTSLVTGTGIPDATVEVFRASRPAGQSGLPVEYLGSTVVDQNRAWQLPVTLQAGDRVAAVQIRVDENTSELSPNVAVGQAPEPPPVGSVLVADDFSRTVTGGWGDAPTGGAWALTGNAANFSVANGVGRISAAAGQARDARQPVGFADVIITGKVAFDHLPNSANTFAYVDARAAGSSAYRATIRTNATGNVWLSLKRLANNVEATLGTEVQLAGVNAGAANQLAFRFEVIGQALRFRVWDADGTEPSGWQVQTTDNSSSAIGQAGVRAYTGSNVPNGPIVVLFDDFEVRRGA